MPGLARDRQQVQHRRSSSPAVAATAGDRVVERGARQDLARPQILRDQLHHDLARARGRPALARIDRPARR
jgi:hypothetical protein